MPELRMLFVALLLTFAFCVPGKLAAQENEVCRPLPEECDTTFIYYLPAKPVSQVNGVCRPLPEVCPDPQNPSRVDKNCYKALADDIVNNSGRCAEGWLKALPIKSRQILAMSNLANGLGLCFSEVESHFQEIDKKIKVSLGDYVKDLEYNPDLKNDHFFSPGEEKNEACPPLEVVREFLACEDFQLSKLPQDRANWTEKDWTCFVVHSFSTRKSSERLADFKEVPPEILANIFFNRQCAGGYSVSLYCEFAVTVREALNQNHYYETITGIWGPQFHYQAHSISLVFLPDEGPPRLIQTSDCNTLWVLDSFDDRTKTKLRLYLYPPKKMENSSYYSQMAGKIEPVSAEAQK